MGVKRDFSKQKHRPRHLGAHGRCFSVFRNGFELIFADIFGCGIALARASYPFGDQFDIHLGNYYRDKHYGTSGVFLYAHSFTEKHCREKSTENGFKG